MIKSSLDYNKKCIGKDAFDIFSHRWQKRLILLSMLCFVIGNFHRAVPYVGGYRPFRAFNFRIFFCHSKLKEYKLPLSFLHKKIRQFFYKPGWYIFNIVLRPAYSFMEIKVIVLLKKKGWFLATSHKLIVYILIA